MLESFLAAPLHFTLEFAGFVVAAGATLLAPSRPTLIPGRAIGRVTAAAGFLALAAAGVVHGASLLAGDTDPVLISLRTAGWLMIGLAVAGATPTGAAAGVISSGRPVLYAPAGGALLTAVAALVRSRSSGSPSLNRLAVAAALSAAAEALIAVAPDPFIEDGSRSGLALTAHGLRFAGYLALASWLWTGIRTSIRSRFVAAYAALLVLVVLAVSTTLTAVITENVERQELSRVRTQLIGAVNDIDQQKKDLTGLVQQIPQAITRSGEASDETLALLAGSLTRKTDQFDFVAFLNERGELVAVEGAGPANEKRASGDPGSVDAAGIAGSSTARTVIGSRSVTTAAGIDRLNDDTVAIVVAAEVKTATNPPQRAGIVVAGRYLDALAVDGISALVDPAAATLFVGDRVLATALNDLPTMPAGAISNDPHSVLAQEQRVDNREFFSAFAPLGGKTDDVTLALSSPAGIIADTRRDVTRGMFLVAVAVGAIALVLAWFSGRTITRPIQNLTATANAVAGGDLTARAKVSGEDEVGRLGATFNDMTASLVRMTQQEQSLRARIETIIQSMADGLVAVDADRKVLAFNVEAELLTGLRAEDVIGRSIDDVLDVRDALGEPVRLPIHALNEGAVGGIYIERRLGTPVPVAISTAVLRDDEGEAAGGVAVIRDMTRERELEKLKGEFLANISHELRTPLTPIKGYAEILARSGVSADKVSTFAHGILDSTQRLQRIVALLVDYSQIEAGRLSPQTSSVDIGSMVESLAEEWTKRAPNHEVQASINHELPRVSGDKQLLQRTLEEVMDNAVKFSPGGGAIRIEARRGTNGADGSAFVEVSVSDEGIGIPPEELPAIFSDFHQLDSSETRTYGGLGLGLAFVQRIIQAHRGEVKVQSEPDHGTRLTISVPAVGETSARA
jgi:PAS domain S-box-containing protein